MIDKEQVTKAFQKLKTDEANKINFEDPKEKNENMESNIVDKHYSNISKMRMKFSLLCLKESGQSTKKRNNRNVISKLIEDQNRAIAKINNQIQLEVFSYLELNCQGFKDLSKFEKTFKIPAKLDIILGYQEASVSLSCLI